MIARTSSAPPDAVNPTMEDVWKKIQKLYDVHNTGERTSADEWLQVHQVAPLPLPLWTFVESPPSSNAPHFLVVDSRGGGGT